MLKRLTSLIHNKVVKHFKPLFKRVLNTLFWSFEGNSVTAQAIENMSFWNKVKGNFLVVMRILGYCLLIAQAATS